MKVNTLKLTDKAYPEPLRHIYQPPQQLYYLGASPGEWLNLPKLAVVGSRKATAYGLQTTNSLIAQLVGFGVVIISGLALGIDATAHRAALENSGTTVAIMGGGLDRIFPVNHLSLARQIIEQDGTLLSEYPAGQPALAHQFIARNRIISGLADSVLVVQAARLSGALHTARFGLEQGKTVLAVPGRIDDPAYEGCNNLIKSGATPVTSVEDITAALGIEQKVSITRRVRHSPESEKILKLIGRSGEEQFDLASASGLDSSQLNRILTELELSGEIRAVGAGQWTITLL